MEKKMKINNLCPNKTTNFAKEELENYLFSMGAPDIEITLSVENECDSLSMDDKYSINVDSSIGTISANTPRALLIAVYRYLTLIGCRFLRPGKKYEIVPVYDKIQKFFAKEEYSAHLRHRGVCIEGFDSMENIEDFLDWIPKIGFNSFFFQFKTPHTFLSRWYNYANKDGKEWTEKQSKKALDYFDTLMSKRGLIRHRMGHGWTAEIIGAKNIYGWDNENFDIPDSVKPMIAQINGKRELRNGVAVNTNLCMTNKDALDAFSSHVTNYLADNPDTEYLHIWLADGHHNFCECENCKDLTPADQYITLLNYLDSSLTKKNINTKLCLLMYEDLFWPPVKKSLDNPDRFVLMFAPIHRTFNQSYSEIKAAETIPQFNLNQTTAPKDIESNMAFLREWKKMVPCDSFVYDYYLGRAHHSDPSHFKIAKIMYNDIKAYPQMQLNGIISCQELRVAFPNAFANYAMARVTFDPEISFEEIANEYYTACYGDSANEVINIMNGLSDIFDCDYINYMFCPTPRKNSELADKMKKIPDIADKIEELIKTHNPTKYKVQEFMWNGLKFFADYIRIFALMTEYKCLGKDKEAEDIFENKLIPLVKSNEEKDQGALDASRLIQTIKSSLNGKM